MLLVMVEEMHCENHFSNKTSEGRSVILFPYFWVLDCLQREGLTEVRGLRHEEAFVANSFKYGSGALAK
jgi:hypothetical protein